MKTPFKIPALYTPIRVDWLDSVESPGWQYRLPDEKLDLGLRMPMITRGVLIAVDAVSIAVSTTFAPRGPNDLKEGHLSVLTIPKGCIVAIRVIP